jgi:NitT/TauT family transport system substrate-binding protein
MKTINRRRIAGALVAAFAVTAGAQALAADKIKIAISQKGLWDTATSYFAAERGFFKAEGLDVSYLFTAGGTETLQTVMTGTTAIATGTGILGVIGTYGKGGAVRIIRSEILGAPEAFWMVKADSKIKSAKDFNGKQVAFSRPGSTTHLIVLTMARNFGVKPKLVSTGKISASRIQLMSGQIDVGFSIPPFNLDLVKSGAVRVVFRATEVPEIQQQTIRVNVAHKDLSPDIIARFNRAYEKTLAWMYDKPEESAAAYAKFANIPLDIAKETPSYYPRAAVEKREMVGLDRNIADAIKAKFLKAPLTKAQVADMVRIPKN